MLDLKTKFARLAALGTLAVMVWIGAVSAALAARPEPTNWFVGDLHVHRSCGGTPVPLTTISNAMVAADLMVLSLQADMGNGEVLNPATDLPLVNGNNSPASPPGRIIRWDAEWHWDPVYWQFPHQVLGGHILALGITNAVQRWDEYTAPVLSWARNQGGVAGFAHLQYLPNYSFPTTLDCCAPLEYPVEVALGNCDFISQDVAGGDAAMYAYYRLLNCGFRPGWGAGSDYPCNAQIGALVTYVQVDGPLTYRKWIDGLAAGRTVISRNGRSEFLNLRVNTNTIPGGTINLPAGGGTVQVSVDWSSSQAVSGTLEIVRNGVVVTNRTMSLAADGKTNLTINLSFTNSGWVVARRMGGGEHRVHTAAIFVTVNNQPIRASAADAQFYVAWIDQLLGRTLPGGSWASYFNNSRADAHARYLAARAIFAQIASEASALVVTTTNLPAARSGAGYSARLMAQGGKPPYQWAVVGGNWPTGLVLNTNTGEIYGQPVSNGWHTFSLRVRDAAASPQIVTQAVSLAVVDCPAPVTLWPEGAAPPAFATTDTNAVELGVRFVPAVSGQALALRFYKGLGSPGPHQGRLWTSNGTLLASVTFSNTSASGWQEQPLPAPVTLLSNTTYVVSYHAPGGRYAISEFALAGTGLTNGPLAVPRATINAGNGLYRYGSGGFPTNSYHGSHYWADLAFLPAENNCPPSAPGLSRTLLEDTSDSFALPGTDLHQPVTFSILMFPTNGALSGINTNTGAVTYTPAPNYFGPDAFTYRVSDGSLFATGTVTITVLPVNDPPMFVQTPTNRTIPELTTLVVTNAASDVDTPAAELTYALLNAPAGAVISTNGVITWTPTEVQGPSTNLIITVVSDGEFSVTNSFIVIVTEVNEPPTFTLTPSHQTIVVGTPLVVTNAATDPDWPENNLAYVLLNGPAGAAVSPAGVITWTPGPGEVGTNWLVTVVSDGLASATNSFPVRVLPVLEAPVILSIEMTEGAAIVEWTTIPGYAYRLETATHCASAEWVPASEWLPATGNSIRTTNAADGLPLRIYRVRAQ